MYRFILYYSFRRGLMPLLHMYFSPPMFYLHASICSTMTFFYNIIVFSNIMIDNLAVKPWAEF